MLLTTSDAERLLRRLSESSSPSSSSSSSLSSSSSSSPPPSSQSFSRAVVVCHGPVDQWSGSSCPPDPAALGYSSLVRTMSSLKIVFNCDSDRIFMMFRCPAVLTCLYLIVWKSFISTEYRICGSATLATNCRTNDV